MCKYNAVLDALFDSGYPDWDTVYELCKDHEVAMFAVAVVWLESNAPAGFDAVVKYYGSL